MLTNIFESQRAKPAWMLDEHKAEQEYFTCLKAINGATPNIKPVEGLLVLRRLATACPFKLVAEKAAQKVAEIDRQQAGEPGGAA